MCFSMFISLHLFAGCCPVLAKWNNIVARYLGPACIGLFNTQLKGAQSKQIKIHYCVKIMSKLVPIEFYPLSQRMMTGPDLPRMTFDWG